MDEGEHAVLETKFEINKLSSLPLVAHVLDLQFNVANITPLR